MKLTFLQRTLQEECPHYKVQNIHFHHTVLRWVCFNHEEGWDEVLLRVLVGNLCLRDLFLTFRNYRLAQLEVPVRNFFSCLHVTGLTYSVTVFRLSRSIFGCPLIKMRARNERCYVSSHWHTEWNLGFPNALLDISSVLECWKPSSTPLLEFLRKGFQSVASWDVKAELISDDGYLFFTIMLLGRLKLMNSQRVLDR